MGDPESLIEYALRAQQGPQVTGHGAETTVHMPCPFCAAADFQLITVVDTGDRLSTGVDITCGDCGRTGRTIATELGEYEISFEFVQTGGPDPAEWLQPAPRRVP